MPFFQMRGVRKQTYIIERIDDPESQTDLSRRAYIGAGARSQRGLDDLAVNGRRLDAAERPPAQGHWGSDCRLPARPARLTITRTRGFSVIPVR